MKDVKIFFNIFFVLNALVLIFSRSKVHEKIEYDTSCLHKEVILRKGLKINFEAKHSTFNEIVIKNLEQENFRSGRIEFLVASWCTDEQFANDFIFSNVENQLGELRTTEGRSYTFTILKIDQCFKRKKALIYINSLDATLSKGPVIQKMLKPIFTDIYIVTKYILFFIVLIALSYFSFRFYKRQN
jgi:hypothetical protein